MPLSHPTTPKYPWYEDEDRALEERGILRKKGAIFNRRGTVCLAVDKGDPGNPDKRYILKAALKGSQEAANISKVHALQSPRSHIVPAELVECEHCVLVIMPYLTVFPMAPGSYDSMQLLNVFTKLMEGLDLMHDLNVAFVDMAIDNLVFTDEDRELGSFKIAAKEVFFIDYGSSRQMPSGPGSGAVIHDYRTMGGHYPPPEGKDSLDPFAYDIYALGQTIVSIYSFFEMNKTDVRIVPSVQGFIDIVSHPIPTRRPTIKSALKLWSMVTNWQSVLDHIGAEDAMQRDALDAVGWSVVLSRYARSL